jgi:hypothetical protein
LFKITETFISLGGITIKRISLLLFVLLMLFSFTACVAHKEAGLDMTDGGSTGSQTDTVKNGADDDDTDTSAVPGDENAVPSDTKPQDTESGESDTGDKDSGADTAKDKELLQSASIDLDADGINEQVRAVKVNIAASDNEADVHFEGRLEISDGDVERSVVFWKKDEDLSGMMSSMQFEDMDGDGAKDIFVIVPGYGASFTYSNCFVYSYVKDKSCIFISDNELADFIGGFRFAYEKGSGSKLSIINDLHGFSAMLSIEDIENAAPSEEVMYEYADRSWIDPTAVDISESSKLALASEGGRAEIKVPLPVFGMATVNMIGELDLYYTIGNDFRLVLERYEVIDFAGDQKIKAGGYTVKK